MSFISSKTLQDMSKAFTKVQQGLKVKEGQRQLQNLREQNDFELGLATYMTQTNKVNDKLLALIELQKMLVMTEDQTVLILREMYYSDIDKIANIIRRIFSHPQNSKWIGQFLKCDFELLSFIGSVRCIQFIFSLMKDDQKAKKAVQNNFETLSTVFLELLEVIIDSESSLLMLTVTLSAFYQHSIEINSFEYRERVRRHWMIIGEKCRFYETPSLIVLWKAIDQYTCERRALVQPEMFEVILKSINRSISSNNQLSLKYEAYYLKFLNRKAVIFNCNQSIFVFINTLNLHSFSQNLILIRELPYDTSRPFVNHLQPKQQSKSQQLISSIFKQFIQHIFQERYQAIAKQYSQAQFEQKPFFVYLLPLVNYYDQKGHRIINQWVKDHIPQVIDTIGSFASTLKMKGNVNEGLASDFISCIQMLIKFKTLIKIEALPHVCLLIQEISTLSSTLTPICYLFLEDFWEELAQLDFSSLTDFLFKHLQTLNSNQWDHSSQYFSCFFKLIEYLEESYQFCSNLLPNDLFTIEVLKSQQIMVNLLGNVEASCLELNFIVKVVFLTGLLIKSQERTLCLDFLNKIQVSFLIELIKKFQLDGQDSDRLLNAHYQLVNLSKEGVERHDK